MRDAAAWATRLGIARLSNPAVKYRLDRAVGFLETVMEQLLAAGAGTVPRHWPGRILRLADGTTISKPGSPGTDWRVHGVYDLGRGGFAHLELTHASGAERLTRGAPIPGEVRIADRCFARAGTLHQFRLLSGGAADFIVRVRWNAFHLQDSDGRVFNLIAHLQGPASAAAVSEIDVQARVAGQTRLPLRLVILRKPQAAFEATCRKLAATAARKQRALDPRSLVAARFVVLATSLPAGTYPAEEVLAAYRLRWQIELAFKRMKSLLRIDRLPTHTDRASRSWLLSHLILALLCDEISQDVLDAFP